MKLFNIQILRQNLFISIIIYILGIKISFKCMKFKYYKFLFHYYNYLRLIKKYKKHKRTNKTVKRLFITTGNLSLINNIAIINQLKLTENAEISILVWSHMGSEEFQKINETISHFVELKNYYVFCNVEFLCLYKFFINNKIFDFDEVYFPNCRYVFDIVNILFPHTKFNVTDEGVCVQIKHKNVDYSNVEKFIFTKYLEKVDIANALKEDKQKLIFLEKQEFLNVAKKCAQLYPLDIELNKDEKNVILCGTIEGLGLLNFDEILDYQNKISDKLIEKGYTVIFKPHPRDTYEYKEHEKFKILKTKLPLEVYDLHNECLAVVSLFSSASCQMYYYQGIAGFCAEDLDKNCSDFGVNIIAEYSPSFEMLYEIDANNKTFEEVKKEILRKYEKWLNNKPLLSENEYLQKRYNSMKFPPPYPFTKKFVRYPECQINFYRMITNKKYIDYWDCMNYIYNK